MKSLCYPGFLWAPRKGTTSEDFAILSHFMQGLESHFHLRVFLGSLMVKMPILIVNLTQCRITWEESVNEALSRLGWPVRNFLSG